jgi:hypothetical protein
MQHEYDKDNEAIPRVIPKQIGYQYIKRSNILENIKSKTEDSSRSRMSCWWVVVQFLLFYSKFIHNKYEPSLMINLDETSLSQPKSYNQLIAVPSYNKDVYVPEAPSQRG